MYTIDDEKEDLYEEEDYQDSKWDNYKGIVFKVIIIILCIIVLIWLFKALNSNNSKSNALAVYEKNVEKFRLAAEDYFFIKGNKKKVTYITLADLKNDGLINDLTDANNNVCNDIKTYAKLETEDDSYVMRINTYCSRKENEEKFYYHKNTLACLNCKGNTNMTGKKYAYDDTKDKPVNNNTEYSCIAWSNWSKKKENDPSLLEKTKVLVKGVKYGSTKTYSNWSDYSQTPIAATDKIEVETKVVRETTYGDVRTDRDIDVNNPNIKILSTSEVSEPSNECRNGFIYNDICYSNNITVGTLTYDQYISNNYKVEPGSCRVRVGTVNGKKTLIYENCRYNARINSYSKGSTYTMYTYQELNEQDVMYYRYRTVVKNNEPTKYTDKKYEEKDLPSGYVKVPGSEETYYSYRITYCEK